jgi:hypothetical protein
VSCGVLITYRRNENYYTALARDMGVWGERFEISRLILKGNIEIDLK